MLPGDSVFLVHRFWSTLAGFLRFGVDSFSDALFYNVLAQLFFFLGFRKLIKVFFRKARVANLNHKTRLLFNTCFHLSAFIFLGLYKSHYIDPHFSAESTKIFPTISSALFLKTCDPVKFAILALIITSFYILDALFDLHERNFLEGITKLFFVAICLSCLRLNLESYFVLLNLHLSAYSGLQLASSFVAFGVKGANPYPLAPFVLIRLFSWAFVFLNVLPFEILVPTLNARVFHVWLNVAAWSWFCFSVWQSPILKYFYHQTYHQHVDCIGGESVFRCILLEDTHELRSKRILRRICLEQREKIEKERFISTGRTSGGGQEPSTTAKTFQTIKCLMTLKRKLNRIRKSRSEEELNRELEN